jgi:apolipoprotein N-acyltransferase
MMSTESPERLAEPSRLTQPLNKAGQQTILAEVEVRKARVMWPVIATAVLLWCCYFPANCGWLAWVALVPLLCLVRTRAPARRVYFASWACGLLYYGALLQWLRVADDRMYFSWPALALYCSLFVPASLWLVRLMDWRTGLPLPFTFPVVWTALEYLRAHFATGFPWYFLGHTQHDFLPVIQMADLAGAYAVSFLVAAVNGIIFEWLYACRWFRACLALREPAYPVKSISLRSQSIAVLVFLGTAFGYGLWRLGQSDFGIGPRIALIQGNLAQRIRNDAFVEPEAEPAKVVSKHYKDLCDEAVQVQPGPDLIVWPETSFPEGWAEVAPELPAGRIPGPWVQETQSCQALARVLVAHWKTNLLLGVNRSFLGADGLPRSYNSAVLIERGGRAAGHYDKIHRVPFGEYVPLRDWLPWMNIFAPYEFDYSIHAGECLTRFSLGSYRFGVVICYEDTDPYLARQYARPDAAGPAVDFLLNISNDGWFDGTSEHEQHLAICRFRAVECRRAVARAVNMGISAVIDGNGRVIALPGPTWALSKKIAAVVTAAIPIDQRNSLYARWGDWLPWGCWITIGVGVVWSVLWPKRVSDTRLAEVRFVPAGP